MFDERGIDTLSFFSFNTFIGCMHLMGERSEPHQVLPHNLDWSFSMPFIPTPGIAQAIIQYQSNDGVVAINRLYCGATAVPTLIDLEEIGDALYDVFVAQILPVTQGDWNLSGISVRAMNEAEGIEFVDANAYPQWGTVDATIATPSQMSYTVTLNTGLVGRSARGRIYGVGLPVTYQNGVRLTTGGQGALQPAWNLVLSAMETAGHAINVVSFQEGGVVRAAGRPLPVVSLNVRFPLATMRRRLS